VYLDGTADDLFGDVVEGSVNEHDVRKSNAPAVRIPEEMSPNAPG
jgi:hypothetical protein